MEKESTSEVWQWWAGDNDERYCTGPCATREEAIAQAIDTDVGHEETADGPVNHLHLCEALMMPPVRLADYLDLDDLIESAEEQASHDGFSDPDGDRCLFDVSTDQSNDLTERIKRACDEWQQANGLIFQVPVFVKTRNMEQGTFCKSGTQHRTRSAVQWLGAGMTQNPNKSEGCRTCDGTGKVPSAEGPLRPCSRCDAEGFNAWCADRRKEAAQ